MLWSKKFKEKGSSDNTVKLDVGNHANETPEQIIKKISYGRLETFGKYKPLTLEKVPSFDDGEEEYTIIDENCEEWSFVFEKNDIINALKENNNDIKRAFHDLIKLGEDREKEGRIKYEIEKLKEIEERKLVREEAEKRFYGKIQENKRAAISEKDKEIIFSKFNNACAICSRKEGLHTHHKDHNPSNNRMDNLIVLCGVCHKKIHMKVR